MLTILGRREKGSCQMSGKDGVEVVTIRSGDSAEQTIAITELIKIVRFQTPLESNSSTAATPKNSPRAHSGPPSS